MVRSFHNPPHPSVIVLSSCADGDKLYDSNDDNQSHRVVLFKVERCQQQPKLRHYSHYHVISCCCYYLLLLILLIGINHNSCGLYYVHAISSFNDQTNDNDSNNGSSETTTLKSLLLRKRLYDRIQRSNHNNQSNDNDNNSSIYNTIQVHQQQKQQQEKQQGGTSIFSMLNFVFCRFNTKTFVSCWNGLGTVMYEGTPNGCIEHCVLLPLLTPKTYKCGDCLEPLPTISPTISPMPSITKAPIKAPVTPAPVQIIIVPVPVPIIVPVPVPIPSSSGYSITLDLLGMTSEDQTIFRNAANRWNQIIINDIPDIQSSKLSAPPPYKGCNYPEVIDDLYICAIYEFIDGAGKDGKNILGSAGPLFRRSGSGFTITGRMRFDTYDIDNIRRQGTLPSVILHEMGHILGIGTLWKEKGIQINSEKCPYIGSNANNEYKALTGCNAAVPIETDGGGGTACSHWDDECFKTELMSGFIGGVSSPLSKITIASLKDLGYTSVNMNLADSYTTGDMNPKCVCNRRLLEQEEEQQQHEIVENDKEDEEQQRVFFLMNITEQEENDNNNNNEYDLHRNNNNGKSSSRRRRLSDEGRQTAIQYGLSILNEAKIDYDDNNNVGIDTGGGKVVGIDNNSTSPDWTYVGADVISVLMIENDQIYGVIVRSTDILD